MAVPKSLMAYSSFRKMLNPTGSVPFFCPGIRPKNPEIGLSNWALVRWRDGWSQGTIPSWPPMGSHWKRRPQAWTFLDD